MNDGRPLYEQAFDDYKKGLKYKEIAEKYDVSISAVKSWKSRHWVKEELQPESKKVATKNEKGCNQKKKKGGQPGNKNSVGKGAPAGNTNSQKHGAFKKLYADMVDSEMLEFIDSINLENALEQFYDALKGLKVHEAYLIQQINFLKAKYKSGIGIHDVTTKKMNGDNNSGTDNTDGYVQTRTIALHKLLQPLNSELSKVQKNIIKVIESINRTNLELRKIAISESKLNIEEQRFIKEAAAEAKNINSENQDVSIKITVSDDEF